MSGLDPFERNRLLRLAREGIAHALNNEGSPPEVVLAAHPPALCRPGACFVTLTGRAGELRGCIGTIEARRPLVLEVVESACAAALRDPRFPPVTAAELGAVFLAVSVLSMPRPLTVADEGALVAALSPGDDGLILTFRDLQATFLPAVWETLPDPRLFISHLKRKAGLPADFWSSELRFSRYHTESFSDAEMGDDDVG